VLPLEALLREADRGEYAVPLVLAVVVEPLLPEECGVYVVTPFSLFTLVLPELASFGVYVVPVVDDRGV
jgi:hypothetical protein